MYIAAVAGTELIMVKLLQTMCNINYDVTLCYPQLSTSSQIGDSLLPTIYLVHALCIKGHLALSIVRLS